MAIVRPRIDMEIKTLETIYMDGYHEVSLEQLSCHKAYIMASCLPVTAEHVINAIFVVSAYYRRIRNWIVEPDTQFDYLMIEFPLPDRTMKMMDVVYVINSLLKMIHGSLMIWIDYFIGVDLDGNVAMFIKKNNQY
jgi:hypothetical protein